MKNKSKTKGKVCEFVKTFDYLFFSAGGVFMV